jgi:hypothetical protein
MPPRIIPALVAEGLVKETDVAGLRLDEFMEVVADLHPDAVEEQALRSFWHAARVFKKRAHDEMVEAMTAPPDPGRLRRDLGVPAPVRVQSGVHAVTALRPGASVVQWKDLAAAPTPTTSKFDHLLKQLYAVVVTMGANAVNFSQAVVDDPDASESLFLAKFKTMGVATIQGRMSALKRWALFWEQRGDSSSPFWKPRPLDLARFLAKVQQGGPTAAAASFAALKWWKDHVGMPLPLQDPVVMGFNKVMEGHKLHQAVVLPAWVFFRLIELTTGSLGSISIFSASALFFCMACLRFKHLQISHSIRCVGGWIVGVCTQGKRRVQGRRPPFEWGLPNFVAGTDGLFDALLVHLASLRDRMSTVLNFVVADMSVPTQGPIGRSSAFVPRPMPMTKFVALVRSLLRAMGMSAQEALEFTSYSFRRFLPTLADIFRFPDTQASQIGNWQEVVQSADSEACRARHKDRMATRYADDSVITAADCKARAVLGLTMCRDKYRSKDLSTDKLRAANITWTILEKLALPSKRVDNDDIIPATEIVPSESDSDESTASSSSSDEAGADEIPWFQQGSSTTVHLTQGCSDTLFVPRCRDFPFSARHSVNGVGIDSSMKVCQHCLRRAPVAVQKTLKEI